MTRPVKRTDADCAMAVNSLPEKRGDFRGNAGTEQGMVPVRVEGKEWLVEDERDLPSCILG